MPLFEVVVLEKAKKEGKLEKIVIKPTAVVAADEQNAAISIIMDNPDAKVSKDRMEILVRPFV